jgi:hypothetical protein
MFCWETRPGYALHLLNYSNANAFHGWLQSVEPIGEQRIAIKFPAGVGVKSVELLKAEHLTPFHFQDQILHFIVPSVGDYEIAAIITT